MRRIAIGLRQSEGVSGRLVGGGGVTCGHITPSRDQPEESMSRLIHGACVVYIKEGRGIGAGLSTATEHSLWKKAQSG